MSSTLVGGAGKTRALQAVKVSGDEHVPSGFTTWRTSFLPDLVSGVDVPAEIQIRADENDPNGFSWIRGSLAYLAAGRMEVTAVYSVFMRHTGTFHKHQGSEGGQ